jgi:hypothetical protein
VGGKQFLVCSVFFKKEKKQPFNYFCVINIVVDRQNGIYQTQKLTYGHHVVGPDIAFNCTEKGPKKVASHSELVVKTTMMSI